MVIFTRYYDSISFQNSKEFTLRKFKKFMVIKDYILYNILHKGYDILWESLSKDTTFRYEG